MKEIQKEMKIQEAIQNLKYLISGNCTDILNFVEEIEMGIDVLEKQIPQKSIEDGYYDLPCVCPCCGQALDFTDHKTVKGSACEDCAGCVSWKCDCWNTKVLAYEECIEKIKTYFKEIQFAYDYFNTCKTLDNLLKELKDNIQ